MINNLSIIHPFCNDTRRLELQLEVWRTYSKENISNIDITLIDDYSKSPITFGSKQHKIIKELGLKIRIFRILKDLKWNTPGALNLGFTVASKEWAMTMDSDCFLDNENLSRLLKADVFFNRLNKFNRHRIGDPKKENLANTRYLQCSILVHKSFFFKIGGFDEDFTGEYSGGYGFFDNEFTYRSEKLGGKVKIIDGIVVNEWMPSVSGPITNRDHSIHHTINKKIYYTKQKNFKGRPNTTELLRFPWELTYDSW